MALVDKFKLSDTFIRELPGDPVIENSRRQVHNACYSFVDPRKTKEPGIIHVSEEMTKALGLSKEDISSEEFLKVFSGNAVLEGTHPYAMCYGGHQFGNWAGQLGDGRAINLFECLTFDNRWVLQLKGAGETPYSRSADGLAVLRSSIREYLCSEAMFHLGVATTRALSLSLTGDLVLRDVMYNGNAEYEKGAVVCRVSPSFIRFGNFEILAAQRDHSALKALADHTINHFYPEITVEGSEKYVTFFRQVMLRTLDMIIDWQRVGFVHGVMNTDNMSILGLTIDFGPYGWLEGYEHGWTPNTTDAQQKRYRYGNQPNIALWNLLQLANALYPLIDDAKPLEAILKEYNTLFESKYTEMLKSKIGLFESSDTDLELIKKLEENLHLTETDMTIFFRELSALDFDGEVDFMDVLRKSFYETEVQESILLDWNEWFENYRSRLTMESISSIERTQIMKTVNPKYVLRNYMAQLAIDAADEGDYSLVDELYRVLKKPYSEQPEFEKWYAKRPDWARNKVGCSMLSCSS